MVATPLCLSHRIISCNLYPLPGYNPLLPPPGYHPYLFPWLRHSFHSSRPLAVIPLPSPLVNPPPYLLLPLSPWLQSCPDMKHETNALLPGAERLYFVECNSSIL